MGKSNWIVHWVGEDWFEPPPQRLWKTRSGKVIAIRDMDTSHLVNAINHMEQTGRYETDAYGWLLAERDRRDRNEKQRARRLKAKAKKNAPTEITDESEIGPPPKRGISLKRI